MAEAEKTCPVCGSVLESGKFGLICRKCNKEYYYEEKRGPTCPMCSWELVKSPTDSRLYVCSNGNCPTRDDKDTPHTLEELKATARLLNNMDRLVKMAVQKHVSKGGKPPKNWEEGRNIVLREYPDLSVFLLPPRPVKKDKRYHKRVNLMRKLLDKGWSDEKILDYVYTLEVRKLKKKYKGD